MSMWSVAVHTLRTPDGLGAAYRHKRAFAAHCFATVDRHKARVEGRGRRWQGPGEGGVGGEDPVFEWVYLIVLKLVAAGEAAAVRARW
jgi:hypothetical protein